MTSNQIQLGKVKMHRLKIKILDHCPNKEHVRDFYQNKVKQIVYKRDCGVDLIFPEDFVFKTDAVTLCGLGIACEFIPNGSIESDAFDLVPRSSIVRTPLMLANSIGIFDPEYRGEVKVGLRCYYDRNHESTIRNFSYSVKCGERLVQILAPDRKPIQVELVDELTSTERGENGFGSTN